MDQCEPIAEREMAIVTYSPGIETVSGSLAKPKKKDGHNHGDYLIGTHRVAATENPNCSRLYVRKQNTYVRSTQPSTDELNARSRFAAVRLLVKARKRDLEHIADDQENFLKQKDKPLGKKTMNAYLWKVCGDIYDQQNG